MIVQRVELNRRRLRLLVHVCESFGERARGLLLRARLSADTAYLLRPCARIHTFGMTYAIDVLFCDAESCIVDLVEGLLPWRVAGHDAAYSVWELPGGSIHALQLRIGDRIQPAC